MDTLTVTECTSSGTQFDVLIDVAEYSRPLCYLVHLGSPVGSTVFMIRTDDDFLPRAYSDHGTVFFLAGSKLVVWSANHPQATYHLPLVDTAFSVDGGIIVIYHLGCCLISRSGNLVWDYRFSVLEDYDLRGENIFLQFDDGTTHSVSLADGSKVASDS